MFYSRDLKRSFRLLSTKYGGSLSFKKKLPQKEIVVFIGLGGLGGRAINAIKGVAAQKLDNADRRFFLAIDTDLESMKNISETTTDDLTADAQHGWMTEDEKCSLFNEMNSYTVAELPHDIDDWVDRENMDTTVISGQGAHAVRQVGRIMLFSKGNYEVVYNKISDIIQKATAQRSPLPGTLQNRKIKVYIVAGISGGTGSGTIVDISYMVRKILDLYGMATFNVEGVLFTPDVQLNDPVIDPTMQKVMKANFYAAIKEIDYYYNKSAFKKAYSCPLGGLCSAYEYDIFDFCTLVSRKSLGIDIASNSNYVLQKLADALVFEISQSYYFDIAFENTNSWWMMPNSNGLYLPDWTRPKYGSLGYSSFYIPRDELLAYCANKLMKALMDTWNKNILDSKAAQKFMTKYGIGSLRGFAAKLFEYAEASRLFDVPHRDMPRDPDSIGLMKVKNCCSYLDEMKDIAEDEGQEVRVKKLIKCAAMKTDGGIVNPLCTHFDKAFLNELPNTGPAYAVRLLASIDPSNPGILANLQQMLNHIQDEFRSWDADLAVTYNMLYRLGEEFEEKHYVDKNELADFTVQCREYGEKLLQSKMLKYSYEVLFYIYNKINAKNNELFNIYTVTLEYLVEMLQEDSAYVTNPQRCREGNNTVFSFDIVNFEDGDAVTQKFVTLLDALVDNMDIDEKSKAFGNDIFNQIKIRLEASKTTDKQFTVDDVLDIIRHYFANTFELWTDNVIEKICVIAYSDIGATANDIAKIWYNTQKRASLLKKVANDIIAKANSNGNVMLTCADSSKDINKLYSYVRFAALSDTPSINSNLFSNFTLDANWSEYIYIKRVSYFPINLLADLDEYKKDYDAQALRAGIHLDEVHSADDDFGVWRYALPEPYSYMTAKYLGKYIEGGIDISENDRLHMKDLLELAIKAKELGLLVEKADYNYSEQTYFELIWNLTSEINNFEGKKSEIYANIRKAVSLFVEEKRNLDFFDILNRAGYIPAAATPIKWKYHPSLPDEMQARTNMGDDVNFGNFILLLRSNPCWGVQLKKGVELFGKLHSIYDTILNEFLGGKLI